MDSQARKLPQGRNKKERHFLRNLARGQQLRAARKERRAQRAAAAQEDVSATTTPTPSSAQANPAATNIFNPNGDDPSVASSSPRSNNVNGGGLESRVPTTSPAAFFGTKEPLAASERPSIHNYFEPPFERLRKEVEGLREEVEGLRGEVEKLREDVERLQGGLNIE